MRAVVALSLLLALVAWAASFREADLAFDAGDLAEAERQYAALAGQDRARALEGLGAVYLTRGQDDLFHQTQKEMTGLRRSLPSGTAAAPELAAEGGFERGLAPPWGTGHYESGPFNFGIWWNSQRCRSYAKADSAVFHSGQTSLRLTNFSPAAAGVFGTTAQRIRAVDPNALYEVSLWARAVDLKPGAVQLVMDPGWHVRPLALPGGTYDWRFFKAQFSAHDLAFIDLRILILNTGTAWIDDLSLRRLEATEDPLLAADSLRNRGSLKVALERYRAMQPTPAVRLRMAETQAALGQYAAALELYEQVKGPASWPVWMAMGDIYLNLGQTEKALEYFRHVRTGAIADQVTVALADDRMAQAYLRLGDLKEAVVFAGEALKIMTHVNDPHGRARTLCHLSQIQQRAGQSAAARQTVESALPLARATADRQLEADILTQLAILQGETAQACQNLSKAVELRRAIYDSYGLISSLYWLGRYQGDARVLEEAVTILESVRDAAAGGAETLIRSSSAVYEALISLYLKQGKTEKALEMLDRSRSLELKKLFHGSSLDGPRQQLVEAAQVLHSEKEALERRLQKELARPPASQDPKEVEAARRERENRLSDYRQFLRELFTSHPELAGLMSVHPKQLRLKQGTLAKDAAIVEYLCGEQQLYIFVVTPTALDVKVVNLSRQELTARVARLRQAILFGEQLEPIREQAARLYQDLLAPVEAQLKGARSLGVLPNGPLHYLPFQVLHDGRGYLVDRLAIVNLCEESFLAPSDRRPAQGKLLLLGNPDGSLTQAEAEVQAIARLYPGSRTYLGKEARKTLVASAARGYQGLHIASHGTLDRRDVARSYILLAPDGPETGQLTVREIWGLDLKGLSMVTLSACLTGLGECNPGDDLISLENAFVFAGAGSVVASLWPVDDAATAALMLAFYQNLKKLPRPQALQEAQKAVQAQRPHPRFWAPFIVVGPN